MLNKSKFKIRRNKLKKLFYTFITLLLLTGISNASEESKTWSASKKAKKFVKDTVVIGFFATPYGIGWTKPEHLHDYTKDWRQNNFTI